MSARSSLSADDVWVAVKAAEAAGNQRAWGKAVLWADRGLALCGDDVLAEGWLRFYVGTASAYRDLLRAERELLAFQRLAQRHPKQLGLLLGDSFYNLGYVFRAGGRLAEEVKAFHQAAEAFKASGRSGQVTNCQYEMAWSFLLWEQSEDAVPHLLEAERGLTAQGDRELELDLEVARSLLLRNSGLLDESLALTARVLERPDPKQRQRADAAWIAGCNCLDKGRLAEAARFGEEAYEAAVEAWWPPQLERIGRLNAAVSQRTKVGR